MHTLPTNPGRLPWLKWVLTSVGLVGGVVLALSILDRWVFEYLARPIKSGQVKAILQALRCWGEGTTLVFIGLGILMVRRSDWRLIGATFIATLVCAAVVEGTKGIVARPRPADWVAHRGATVDPRNSSFPSGHVATAFAVGRGLSLAYPALTPVCITAGCGTALSRMYEQRHWFSDCLVGAIWGWYAGGMLWLLAAGRWGSTLRSSAPPTTARPTAPPLRAKQAA